MSGLSQLDVHYVQDLEQAETKLRELFRRDSETGCILLSDGLVEADAGWNSALKFFRDVFASENYVSLAVSRRPTRIPDNDLMLPLDCSIDDWINGLQLLVDRLDYYRIPRHRTRPPGLEVRPIRGQGELLEACKLRYRVYRIMGYLEQEFLETDSQIELTWFDTISIHFGAFLTDPPLAPKLIATTRLILTRDEDPRVMEWTRAIAKSRRRLARYLSSQQTQFAQFRLPIFHTLQLNDEMRQAAVSSNAWAELSRVVVAPEWRGCRLSGDLIQLAIETADHMNVDRILLECLEIHRDMYERVGFTFLEKRGEVLGVGKTMIGMERRRPQVPLATAV
jgi:predicted GNAT family N-acyltransferase